MSTQSLRIPFPAASLLLKRHDMSATPFDSQDRLLSLTSCLIARRETCVEGVTSTPSADGEQVSCCLCRWD